MPTAVLLSQSAADVLCCLGLGLALAAVYDAVAFVAGRSKAVIWILDLLMFSIAGVLVCSYAASRSYAGVVRWYHLAGMLLGQWAYFHAFCAITQRVHGVLMLCAAAPFKWVFFAVLQPLAKGFSGWVKGRYQKRQQKQKKKRENRLKQLQTSAKMLYNSR